jgi:hypothetical protein
MGRTKKVSTTTNKEQPPKGVFGISAGYAMIKLNGKMTQLHRVVAEHFVDKPDIQERLAVNHLNLNKLDNRAENLEWVTYTQNMQHCWDAKKPEQKPYAIWDGRLYTDRRKLAKDIDLHPQTLSLHKEAARPHGIDNKYKIIFLYNRKKRKQNQTT